MSTLRPLVEQYLFQPLPLFLAALFAISTIVGGLRLLERAPRSFVAALDWAAKAIIAWQFAIAMAYLCAPSFYEHIEPVIASHSILVADGAPVYPRDPGAVAQLPYGPSCFIANACFIRVLEPWPIFASKLCGICLGIGCLALVWFFVARTLAPTWATPYAAACALCCMPFSITAYWNRPDSLLLIASAIATLSLRAPRKLPAAILFAAAAAAAVNGKLHAPLYLLPLIPAFVASFGTATALAAALLTMGLIALPFLAHPSFPIGPYIAGLRVTASHAIEFDLLVRNLSYACLFLVPYFCFCRPGPSPAADCARPRARMFLLTDACLVVSLVAISVIGAKAGSGPHHLMPILPVLAGLHALRAKTLAPAGRPAPRPDLVRFSLGAAWLVTLLALSLRPQARLLRFILHDDGRATAADITSLLQRHPGQRIAMGYTDDTGYPLTFFGPLVVRHSRTTFVNPPALMDHIEARAASPHDIVNTITAEKFDAFILPAKGEPFSVTSYYEPRDPIFDPRVRAAFTNHYARAEGAGKFRLWRANRLVEPRSAQRRDSHPTDIPSHTR